MEQLSPLEPLLVPQIEPPAPRAEPAAAGPARQHPLRRVQRTAGNRAVQRLVQARLAVSQPGDPYEVEAERAAAEVMRRPTRRPPARAYPGRAPMRFTPARAGYLLPKRCACGGEAGPDGECAACRAKRLALQQKSAQRAPPGRGPPRRGCAACGKKHNAPGRVTSARAPPPQVALAAAQTIRQAHAPKRCPGARRPQRSNHRRDILPAADAGGPADLSDTLAASLTSLPGGGQPLPPAQRDFYETRLGYDLSQVRLHNDSRSGAAARRLNALAFTSGQDIYFAPGRYESDSTRGRHLLAHELAHTIQQAGGGASPGSASPSRAPPPIQRYSLDEFISDAEAVGSSAVETASDALDTVSDTAVAVGETVVEAGQTAVDAGAAAIEWLATTAGQAALEAAQELVAMLGGSISISASGLVVTLPAFPVCDQHPIVVPGPELSNRIPLLAGALPITPELILVGMIDADLSLSSLLNLLLGPCLLGPITIVIDPLSSYYDISGQFSAQAAFNLLATAAQILAANASLIVLLPGGAIAVPLIGLEAGLQETLTAVGSGLLTVPAALTYSAGTISLAINPRLDLLGSLDFMAAAAARLLLLGNEVCSLTWPFFRYTLDAGATLGVDLGLTYDPSTGLSTSVSGVASGFALDTITSGFFSFYPQVDCEGIEPLLRLLCVSGLIPPSPCVGAGPAPRPTPTTCPIGLPLAPDVKDPGIPSKALCRGACGYNCPGFCKPLGDLQVIVPTASGDYYICTYPAVIECGTHQGCRDHDNCYDCCAASGFSTIGDICHLACDCGCLLTHGASNCPTWALGGGPFDGTLLFADPPFAVGPLPGPIPGPAPGGGTGPGVAPALPAGDCCSAALAAGLDGGDFGGVICCNNTKHACVWSSNIPAGNATARGVIAGCVGEHEAVHLNHVDCTGAALERPPFKPGISPADGECAAYLVEIACYQRRIGECGCDAACRAEVQHELDFACTQAAANCGSAPPSCAPGGAGGAGSTSAAPRAQTPTNEIRLQLQAGKKELVPSEKVAKNCPITVAEGVEAVDKLMARATKSHRKACQQAASKMKSTIRGLAPQGIACPPQCGHISDKLCDRDVTEGGHRLRVDLNNDKGHNFQT